MYNTFSLIFSYSVLLLSGYLAWLFTLISIIVLQNSNQFYPNEYFLQCDMTDPIWQDRIKLKYGGYTNMLSCQKIFIFISIMYMHIKKSRNKGIINWIIPVQLCQL